MFTVSWQLHQLLRDAPPSLVVEVQYRLDL